AILSARTFRRARDADHKRCLNALGSLDRSPLLSFTGRESIRHPVDVAVPSFRAGPTRIYNCISMNFVRLPIFLVCLPLIFAQKAPPPDLPAAARQALAVISGKLKAPGLQQSVEVLRDRWGVAHIYAQNQHDLFFAQGF